MFWGSSQPREKTAKSTLSGDIFFIVINDHIFGWAISGTTAFLKFTEPVSKYIDNENDEFLAISGNEKYVGLIFKYGQNVRLLTGLTVDFGAESFITNTKIINLPPAENSQIIMPYLSETAVLSEGKLWLGTDEDGLKISYF